MGPSERDHAAYGTRVMRPERARLEECRALAGDLMPTGQGNHDRELAQRLWEALAPGPWIGDPLRRFRSVGTIDEEHPVTVGAALALASDPRGVAGAEQLGREVALRLWAWGAVVPTVVTWRVLRADRRDREPSSRARGETYLPLASVLREVEPGGEGIYRINQAVLRENPRSWWHFRAGTDATYAYRWRVATAEGLRVTSEVGHPGASRQLKLPPGTVGRAFAELPDPFEPLLTLWETGYALDGITPKAIILVAPEV